MKAYFFSRDNILGYEDGRKIRQGITHKVKGDPVLCKHGLHASLHPFDALKYSNGAILWEVEIGGTIVKGDDKIVGTERTYIKSIDATDLLRKFARMCALDAIDLWDAPEIVIKYLKTGDESIRAAARDAARGSEWAAWAAARGAAWAAAWVAWRYAARDAAWNARAAAWAAAGDVAWAAARSAAADAAGFDRTARKRKRNRFKRMVNKEI